MKRQIAGSLLVVQLLCPGAAWTEEDPPPPAPSPVAGQSDLSPAERKAQAEQALLEGRELMRKGFAESAIVAYRKAIDLDPELVQAYVELGKILVDTKNQGFAITIYQKLAQLQPNELQWKEILFDLHTAYEMPQEAAALGEEILKAKPNDVEFIKRLAEVYRGYGLQDRYAQTLSKAAALTKDARLYFQAGEAYLAADMKPEAVAAYRQAVALEPTNLEYQAALGKGLNNAGDAYEARDHYAALVQKYPNSPGLKDRQAEAEVAVGDRLLERRRYVAAREAYESAQALLGGPSTTGLGASIAERIAKARRLNHVYFEAPVENGQQGDNNYTWVNTVVGVPLDSTDLTFSVWGDNRWVGATGQPLPTQHLFSVLGGLDYKLDEAANVFAYAGTNQLFRVGGFYQTDTTTAGLRVRRDIVSYTPLGLNTRCHWTGVEGQLSQQINDWVGIGGNFAFNNYDDGIPETLYNIGPFFTPINRPNDFVWGLGFNHGGLFNEREANPLLRFGPTNYQINSYGTNIEHWLSEAFRYHLGYYYTTSNVGSNGNTYIAGFDAQLGEGSYAWLNFEYGNFLAGRLAQGLFSTAANNYILQGGVRVTF